MNSGKTNGKPDAIRPAETKKYSPRLTLRQRELFARTTRLRAHGKLSDPALPWAQHEALLRLIW
jgi:hypothetical protein